MVLPLPRSFFTYLELGVGMGNSLQQSSGPLQEISLDLLFELDLWVGLCCHNCSVMDNQLHGFCIWVSYMSCISESSCLLLDPVIWNGSFVCWMFSWFENIRLDQIIKFDCMRSNFLIQSFVSGLDLQICFFVCIFICSIDLYFICTCSPFAYCSIIHMHRLHASTNLFVCRIIFVQTQALEHLEFKGDVSLNLLEY